MLEASDQVIVTFRVVCDVSVAGIRDESARSRTFGRMLNVHVEAVELDYLIGMVERTRDALGDHCFVTRAEHVPELVCQEVGLMGASQLIREDAAAEGEDDLLAVCVLAGRDLCAEAAAV